MRGRHATQPVEALTFDGTATGAQPITASVAPAVAVPESLSRHTRVPPGIERAILMGLDALALAVALVLTGHGRGSIAVVYGAAAALFLVGFGAYRPRLQLSELDDAPRLAEALTAALLAVSLIAWAGRLPHHLFPQALISAVAVLCARFIAYPVIRLLRRHGLVHRSVVVGAGQIGIELHRRLSEHPEYGVMPVGVVDDVDPPSEIPLLGRVDDLESVIDRHRIRRVIVAFGPGAEQKLVATLRATVQRDVEVCVVPRLFELGLAPAGYNVGMVWGIPLYRIRRGALRNAAWWTKRMFDTVLSGLMLLALAPLCGALALAVKLTSPGPILFRQKRIGQHGRTFEVLKFRTMAVNDDADTTWSVENDPRVTSVGRWLRRFSLDEIPQLWNVLRADMSLVGPRPERPQFVHNYKSRVDGYGDRHRLPVGLTGLAQVHGLRGDTSIVERARFDNFYIEHWSPWQDMKILLRTAAAVVRQATATGARQQGTAVPEQAPPVSTGPIANGQAGDESAPRYNGSHCPETVSAG